MHAAAGPQEEAGKAEEKIRKIEKRKEKVPAGKQAVERVGKIVGERAGKQAVGKIGKVPAGKQAVGKIGKIILPVWGLLHHPVEIMIIGKYIPLLVALIVTRQKSSLKNIIKNSSQ